MSSKRMRIVILGAAGRDFHNFNVAHRGIQPPRNARFVVNDENLEHPKRRPSLRACHRAGD